MKSYFSRRFSGFLLPVLIVLFVSCSANNGSGNSGSTDNNQPQSGDFTTSSDLENVNQTVNERIPYERNYSQASLGIQPIDTSVTLRLEGSINGSQMDASSRMIFGSADSRVNFGQQIMDTSYLSKYFTQVDLYNHPYSFYHIVMDLVSIYEPAVPTRLISEKTVVFEFTLILNYYTNEQRSNEEPNPPPPIVRYRVNRYSLSFMDNKGENPREFYSRALNRYLNMAVAQNFIKTRDELEAQYEPPAE